MANLLIDLIPVTGGFTKRNIPNELLAHLNQFERVKDFDSKTLPNALNSEAFLRFDKPSNKDLVTRCIDVYLQNYKLYKILKHLLNVISVQLASVKQVLFRFRDVALPFGTRFG